MNTRPQDSIEIRRRALFLQALRPVYFALVASTLMPLAADAAIEEIIVTAQKREQSKQDIPISISAIGGAELTSMGIQGTEELRFGVPGLMIDHRSHGVEIHVRGVGSSITSSGAEPSVPIYVDDIYNPSANTSVFNFNNIERIEVLKGPQGTLFGRNASGGVISVVTKEPNQEPSLDLEVGYGRYDTWEAKAYGTTGLTDTLAADLAVFYKDVGDGFITNIGENNKKVGIVEENSFRSKWVWTPTDDTGVRFIAAYRDYYSELATYRQAVEGTVALGGFPYSGDFYTVDNDFAAGQWIDSEYWLGSLRVDHSFARFDFASITGYQDESSDFTTDQDATPLPSTDAFLFNELQTWSQEFQFKSNKESPFSWIVGLYYFYNKSEYDPLRLVIRSGSSPPFPIANVIDIFTTTHAESYAVFADTTFPLAANTNLTLGARYTWDKIDIFNHTFFLTIPNTIAHSLDDEYEEPTWRVVLDHQFTDDVMAFASYSRGYKSGLYNSVVTSPAGPLPAVDPEIFDAYEIGVKSEWLNNRLRVNGSVYYIEGTDLQVNVTIPAGTIIDNAAEGKFQGAELEVVAEPTDRLNLNFTASVMDTEYVKYEDALLFPPNTVPPGGNIGNVVGDVSGNDIVRAPDFTMTTTASYRIPVGYGELTPTISYAYNSGYLWEVNGRVKEPSLDMLNAELVWSSSDARYRVSLWGRNLLDEEYSFYTSASTRGDVYSPAWPKTYGMNMAISF